MKVTIELESASEIQEFLQLWTKKESKEKSSTYTSPCNQKDCSVNPCSQGDCNYTTVGYLVYDLEHCDVLTSLDPETWHDIRDVKKNPLDFPAVYNLRSQAELVSNDFLNLKTTLICVRSCEKSGKLYFDLL